MRTDPEQNAKSRAELRNREMAERARDEREDGDETLQDKVELRDRASWSGADEPTASWQDIKGRFVDDPAGALAAAEEAVRAAVDRRIRALKDEATAMCASSADEDDGSTEAQRTRLIRYQAYCERLSRNESH